jgi:hypothetical protein
MKSLATAILDLLYIDLVNTVEIDPVIEMGEDRHGVKVVGIATAVRRNEGSLTLLLAVGPNDGATPNKDKEITITVGKT